MASAGERIDGADGKPTWSLRNHIRNVASDCVTEWVLHGLKASSSQNAHAPPPPLLWRHAIEMNVVGIAETVAPLLLNLPQFDELVALGRAEQKMAIILRLGTIGTLRGHAPSADYQALPSFS